MSTVNCLCWPLSLFYGGDALISLSWRTAGSTDEGGCAAVPGAENWQLCPRLPDWVHCIKARILWPEQCRFFPTI